MQFNSVIFGVFIIIPVILSCKLKIIQYEGNTIGLQCREDCFDGQEEILYDEDLLLFNATGQRVTSLFDEKEISFTFEIDGQLRFEVLQSIEGYYYCSRNASEGLPDPTDYITLLARPTSRSVPTSYTVQVGETVRLLSGVSEGSLSSHYTVAFYKDEFMEYKNISRGDDISLIISPVQLSDNGTYDPEILIETGTSGPYVVPTNQITLTVYLSPIIERAPESVVVNEEEASVSFMCIVTGAPLLQITWFKDDTVLNNHTVSPSHYSFNDIPSDGGKQIASTLTIHNPTYEDSGQYACIGTVLNDKSGDEGFITQESATLTVLESNFYVKVVITEYQQLQLWVELNRPLNLPVIAVVYFTLKSNPDYQETVPSHSILTNNTVMVFQLESHDIPDGFRDKDLFVQVALRVGSTASTLVPDNLALASTANLDEPTVNDCSREETYRQAIIVGASVIGGVLLFIAVLVFIFSCYACHRSRQRTGRQKNMPNEERMHLQNQNTNLTTKLCQETDKEKKEDIRKRLEMNDKQLQGDGPDSETSETHDHSETSAL